MTGSQATFAETRAVASNPSGDYIVVYSGWGPGDIQGIFARRFNRDDVPLGPEFLVNVTTDGNQRYPSVAMGEGGETVIAWSGTGSGDNDGGVFVRLYDSNGVPVSGEIKVSQTVCSAEHRPVVAKGPNGDFIVTWSGNGVGDTTGVLRGDMRPMAFR